MKKLILACVVVCLTACGGAKSPTTPTPTPTPTPPPPTAQTFTLTGNVSETAPTASTRIPGATVTFADGSNAGKSATTDGAGTYSITGLQSGGFTVNITASGYQDVSRPLTLTANATLNAQLNPNPQTLNVTKNDSLSGGDTPCSDGTFTKACRIVTLPIHHNGTISATLTWDTSSTDLDLTLWRNGSLIAESKSATARNETVSTNATGGATFELRVTYYQGSVITPFQLRMTYPN